jgi:hypothetical protein
MFHVKHSASRLLLKRDVAHTIDRKIVAPSEGLNSV